MGFIDLIARLKEHEHSPRWNYETTDLLSPANLATLHQFEKRLVEQRIDCDRWRAGLKAHVEKLLAETKQSTIFHQRVARFRDFHSRIESLADYPTTDRSMLVKELWSLPPQGFSRFR